MRSWSGKFDDFMVKHCGSDWEITSWGLALIFAVSIPLELLFIVTHK